MDENRRVSASVVIDIEEEEEDPPSQASRRSNLEMERADVSDYEIEDDEEEDRKKEMALNDMTKIENEPDTTLGSQEIVPLDPSDWETIREDNFSNDLREELEYEEEISEPEEEGKSDSEVPLPSPRKAARRRLTSPEPHESVEEVEEKRRKYKVKKDEDQKAEEARRKQVQGLRRLSPHDRIFPDVKLSQYHTIAFKLSPNYKPGDDIHPYPDHSFQKWDKDYVPMPWDSNNFLTIRVREKIETQDGDSSDKPEIRYKSETIVIWERVEEAFSNAIMTCEDIEYVLRSTRGLRKTYNINCLKYAVETLLTKEERIKFFNTVIPTMIDFCLNAASIITQPIHLLKKFMNHSISLTQRQIGVLLSLAFFSVFPPQIEEDVTYQEFNFAEKLFHEYDKDDEMQLIKKAQKIRCILHYFERITEEMPKGIVTFSRKAMRRQKNPEWNKTKKPLKNLIVLNEGTIESDGVGFLQVDFANRYIGGGVLGRGCVQEEILFLIYPELLVSMLFTQVLTSNEALLITGAERFSSYKGYASNFEFDGDFIDTTPWDSNGRKCSQIIAIDALYIHKSIEQFHTRNMERELVKAWVGFLNPSAGSVSTAIATGKWGCGAFNGDPHLKAILQIMAASYVERDLVFFTFGDSDLQKDLEEIYNVIKLMTIDKIWALLKQYDSLFCNDKKKPSYTLKEFLTEFTSANDEELMEEDDDFNPRPSTSNSKGNPNNKTLQEVSITKFYEKKESKMIQKDLTNWFKDPATVNILKGSEPPKGKAISSRIPGDACQFSDDEIVNIIENDEEMDISEIPDDGPISKYFGKASSEEKEPKPCAFKPKLPVKSVSPARGKEEGGRKSDNPSGDEKKKGLIDFFA